MRHLAFSSFKKITAAFFCTCLYTSAAFCQDDQHTDFVVNTAQPAVFTPGVVSTDADEFAPSFTPDGKSVYFSADDEIYFSKKIKGKWQKRVVAGFSGRWHDMDPFVSPDGKKLFFSSYRPLDGADQSAPQKFAHIWYVEHISGDEWSTPHHLGAPVNMDGINNYAPSVSKSGTLCFFSPRRDARYARKSYYARLINDSYEEPKPLLLNDADVKDTYIAPDESYLLFTCGADIYISYRNNTGWSRGKKLGANINNGKSNAAPYVSPDGKTLYYCSEGTHGILMIPVNR